VQDIAASLGTNSTLPPFIKRGVEMKKTLFAMTCLFLFSAWAHAAETLDADAVRKLISGNTVHGLTADGRTPKIHFAADGTAIRKEEDGDTREGKWQVKDDGTQCVIGLPGGCAKVVRNDDGTHSRVLPDGNVP
jgi:hypothetical protein